MLQYLCLQRYCCAPSGNEIVSGKVCAKVGSSSCCGWSGTIRVKKCPKEYVYQLAVPKDCPMSYCVGEAMPCPMGQVHNKNAGTCLGKNSNSD